MDGTVMTYWMVETVCGLNHLHTYFGCVLLQPSEWITEYHCSTWHYQLSKSVQEHGAVT